MTVVHDQTADLDGRELHRLQKLYAFPDFVKSAIEHNSEAAIRPQSLAVNAYADVADRQFPCHSAPATWLSALYFHEKRAELPVKRANWIEERLNSFAVHFGIKAACDQLKSRYEELHKDATDRLPDSHFAHVWVDQDSGHKDRRLPLRNPNEIKAATDWFEKYRDDFVYEDRRQIAQKIMKRAEDMRVNLGPKQEMIDKHAGQGVGNPGDISSAFHARALLTKDANTKACLIELARIAERTPQELMNLELLTKMAKALDLVDRDLRLVGKYTDIIQRPEDALFGATRQKLADWRDSHCCLLSGTTYRKEDFTKLSVDEVQALLGEDFAHAVEDCGRVDPEKMAEVGSTLPLGDAMLLDRLLADTGIRPVHTKQASIGFSNEALAQLASVT